VLHVGGTNGKGSTAAFAAAMLRAAGLREEEIFEAIQIVAIYNSNNRINNALGMQPNVEARTSGVTR